MQFEKIFSTTAAEISLHPAALPPPSLSLLQPQKGFPSNDYNARTLLQHSQEYAHTITHAHAHVELDTPGLPQAISVGFPLLLPRR